MANDKNNSVRQWLLREVEYRKSGGQPPYGPYGFLLRHGQPYINQPRPKGLRKRKNKQCYLNTLLLVMDSEDSRLNQSKGSDVAKDDGSLVYVEGFADPEGDGFVVEHAWAADQDGNVLDLTWEYSPKRVYFGIPFQYHVIRKVIGDGYMKALLVLPGGFPAIYTSPPVEWLHESAWPKAMKRGTALAT